MRLTWLLLLLVAFSLFSSLAAIAIPTNEDVNTAQPSKQVIVDVVVQDKNGQRVKGLRSEDFRVFENHQEQQISSFSVYEAGTASSPLNALAIPESTFTNADDTETDSINVILLDEVSTSIAAQQSARDKLIRFFSQKSNNSHFAIFVLGSGDVCVTCDGLKMLQGVTQNKNFLIGAIKRRGAHAPLLRVSSLQVEDTNLQPLAQLANVLRDLPGRKQLIWMADNFDAAPVARRGDIWFPPKFRGWDRMDPLSPTQMLHLASGRLAAARVAVYPIDLTGRNKSIEKVRFCLDYSAMLTQTSPNMISLPTYEPTYSCNEKGIRLDLMAAETGGKAFHGPGGIQEALSESVSDGDGYYSISYTSTNPRFNGGVRSIRLEVRGGEYQLYYRRHYFADDPATLFYQGSALTPDIVVPKTVSNNNPSYVQSSSALVPWMIVRPKDSSTSIDAEPIMEAMRFGTPESTDVIFGAHIEALARPVRATVAQMDLIANLDAVRSQRIAEAVIDLNQQQILDRGHLTLNTLPPADPVYVQNFQIDYLLPARQLRLSTTPDGELAARGEVEALAYDASGRKLAAVKGSLTYNVAPGDLENFKASRCKVPVQVYIPEEATTLRLAIRDGVSGKSGSLEIPLWAIPSHHERRRLEVPVLPDEDKGKKKKSAHR
jgi:VWFA-related protein